MAAQSVGASVAVIGAGPAGLFAARELAENGYKVALFNRNIKPGGLAEYGIYPDKYRIKDGLREQFKKILDCEHISYFGNVSIGEEQPLKLDDLRRLGFAAILVTCGAQGTKWLGLPGEDLTGVYHAKTLVYYYNHLPPFASLQIKFGRKVVIVGVGNVMTAIVRFLVGRPEVEEITTIARRGPAEVKFDRKELEHIAAYLDRDDFETEIERVAPAMKAVGQDPAAAVTEIREVLAAVTERAPKPVWRMHFLYSPQQMTGRDGRNLDTLLVEENILELRNGDTKAKATGKTESLAADMVVFAIGDKVDDELGLPLQGSEFIKSTTPRFPIDGVSYELMDEKDPTRMADVFVGGWSRNASTGMVGIARRDGANAAKAVMAYLETKESAGAVDPATVEAEIKERGYRYVKVDALTRLEQKEKELAAAKGLPEFKFDTDDEMLRLMGL
jgi:ferredoxin--NADP+ reductase